MAHRLLLCVSFVIHLVCFAGFGVRRKSNRTPPTVFTPRRADPRGSPIVWRAGVRAWGRAVRELAGSSREPCRLPRHHLPTAVALRIDVGEAYAERIGFAVRHDFDLRDAGQHDSIPKILGLYLG